MMSVAALIFSGQNWLWPAAGVLLLVVDHWNGAPDDDQVGVRILTAAGLADDAGPSWTVNDTWHAYGDGQDPSITSAFVPATSFQSTTAYVAGGRLVCDARAL